MDKTQKVHFRDNQSLSVESYFNGTESIQEVIKQYLSKRWIAKRELGDSPITPTKEDRG